MFNLTALVTLAALLLYGWFGFEVARGRAKFGIKAPATTGNPDFERLYRIHMNTLEWLPIFLPSLWLFAWYVSDAFAALIGLVWIAGRVLYQRGYQEAAEKRSLGFTIQGLAAAVLLVGALIDIVARLLLGD